MEQVPGPVSIKFTAIDAGTADGARHSGLFRWCG
jgi:hypothetical protein